MPIEKNKSWDGYISADAFEKASALGLQTDKYALESEFRLWIVKKGIKPKNPDAVFITFCKNAMKKSGQGKLF